MLNGSNWTGAGGRPTRSRWRARGRRVGVRIQVPYVSMWHWTLSNNWPSSMSHYQHVRMLRVQGDALDETTAEQRRLYLQLRVSSRRVRQRLRSRDGAYKAGRHRSFASLPAYDGLTQCPERHSSSVFVTVAMKGVAQCSQFQVDRCPSKP